MSFPGPALKNQTSLLKCPKRLTTIPAGSKPEPMGWSGRGLVPQACLAPVQMRSDAECSAWSHQRLCWTRRRPGIPAPRSLSALFLSAQFSALLASAQEGTFSYALWGRRRGHSGAHLTCSYTVWHLGSPVPHSSACGKESISLQSNGSEARTRSVATK